MIYIPLGVGVVIPPWNFPLAILVGMTVAALVTGNTVVVKPSSETPTIAAKFAEVLLEAGFPERSFTLLTGSGAAVGDVLVEHPKTRFVSFTGSRDVGLRINELAAKPQPGQIWIKRVIAEMGGKDAIVVDGDCDLDKAVDGVLASAFGYQGQKCSACSRAIVDAKVYDAVSGEAGGRRPAASKVGPSRRSRQLHGAGDQRRRAARPSSITLRPASAKAGWWPAATPRPGDGYFVPPTIIADVDPRRAHFPGRDFRAGAGGDQGARFRARPGTGQRFRNTA